MADPTMLNPLVINVDGCDVEIRSCGPYTARPAKDGDMDWALWYIAGPDGRRNVASFGRGAVLCSREMAQNVVAALHPRKGEE